MSISIESDLKEILTKIDQKLDNLQKDVTDLKIELIGTKTELKGEIRTLDERLTGKINTLDAKVDGLSIRLQNQEFTSRAILISLVLVILGGAARMFGFVPPNP
jgi:hypothetical protein